MPYPKKVDNVYVETLDNEVCVYDWEQTQMHALNPTAALVWEQCDGQTDPAQMATRLEEALNIANAEKLVALSLDRLEKARLLAGITPQAPRTITRREVLKMAGIGVALLPVITSMALPSAAEAQSCIANCTVPAFFQVGNCQDACQTEAARRNGTLCGTELITQGFCNCFISTSELCRQDQ